MSCRSTSKSTIWYYRQEIKNKRILWVLKMIVSIVNVKMTCTHLSNKLFLELHIVIYFAYQKISIKKDGWTKFQANLNSYYLFALGMAFALLTSVAPVYGLYTSFFPVVLYMLLGTGHHVSTGKSTKYISQITHSKVWNNFISFGLWF